MKAALELLLIFFIGCNSNTPNKGNLTSQTVFDPNEMNHFLFKKDLEQIPTLHLPFEMNFKKDFNQIKIDFKDSLVKKFYPNGLNVIGIVFKKMDKTGVLYITSDKALTPWLFIYDYNGVTLIKKPLREKFKIPRKAELINEYLRITDKLIIESAYVTGYIIKDINSSIVDTFMPTYGLQKYGIDSLGNLIDK